MNKKGYYFTIDALVALVLVLGIVMVIKPQPPEIVYTSNLQQDILVALSNVEIGVLDDPYAETLRSTGKIKDPDKTVLEQLGEFYSDSDQNYRFLMDSILDNLSLSENLAIYFDQNLVGMTNKTPYENASMVFTARQLISGVQAGAASTGFSSIASLGSRNKVEYFYFGGYVGDGNITAKLTGEVIDSKIEGVFSGNFSLDINNNHIGDYDPDPNEPYLIDLSPYVGSFVNGDNYVELKSTTEDNLFIAGGFIKTIYNLTSSFDTSRKHRLPGIDGIINLYDSFYIPGELNSINISLHYNSSYDIFMTIGNKTVYEGNSSGTDITEVVSNNDLLSLFDYDDLAEKTIPIRIGIKDIEELANESKPSDVFSVSDLSSSMSENIPGIGELLAIAKEANKAFIDVILNGSLLNRVGLAGYNSYNINKDDLSYYKPEYYHNLSRDNESLNQKVDDWETTAGTCICCGIIQATNGLANESNESRRRSMLVMSDGKPNAACYTNDPAEDAVTAACKAYENHGIKVYTLGIGDLKESDRDVLESIANCGRGGYYYEDDLSELVDTYKDIARDVLIAEYQEQTIIAEGLYTKLFPDSYILFEYDNPFSGGVILNGETPIFGSSAPQGVLTIPDNSLPYEVGIVSYSGPKWTSKIEVNNSNAAGWETIYDLSEYNQSYTSLGDPYIVNVPISKIAEGNNTFDVSIGVSPDNLTGGSRFNKIIYSVVRNTSSFTPVVRSAEGCLWDIQFEDGLTDQFYVPEGYSGPDLCYYNASIGANNNYAIFNDDDAIEYAIFLLLKNLDVNKNGMIDTKFQENDLAISSTEIAGIPFTWDTEVQARTWK